jgi:hypothetical protein
MGNIQFTCECEICLIALQQHTRKKKSQHIALQMMYIVETIVSVMNEHDFDLYRSSL